jgi:hypothetical protein
MFQIRSITWESLTGLRPVLSVLALFCYILFLLHPILAHADIGFKAFTKQSSQVHILSLQDDLQANCPVCAQLGGNAALKPNSIAWLPLFAKADPSDIYYERYPVYPVRTDDSRAPPVSSPQS